MSPSPHVRQDRSGAIIAVVCIALATVISATASLNVALPDIARSTHASQTNLEWIIDAYSVLFAALLLPGGAIGDRYGRRRALLAGLAIFGVGSAAAMTAGSATELIALRGVLGIGAALVMPATLSTITGAVEPEQRTRAVSIWAGVAGGGAVLGLLCAGVLLHMFSWTSVFGLNVALAAISIAGTLRYVPESADADAPPLDVIGALLAFLGLVVLVYTVIEAPDTGWLAARSLAGFGLAAGFAVAFVRFELTREAPLLNPRVFTNRRLSAGCGSIFVQFFTFYGFTFCSLQYLQIVQGHSPLIAAICVLPLAGWMMTVSRVAPRLTARLGTRRVCSAGLALISIGMVVLSQVSETTPYLLFATGLTVTGIGMGAAMTPATDAITDSLPRAQQGIGSALNDLSREFGGALGIAVIGSVLDAIYRSHLTLPGASPQLLHRAQSSLGVAQLLGGHVAAHAHTAFVSGMHVALLCGAAASMLAAGGVLLALRRTVAPTITQTAEPAATTM